MLANPPVLSLSVKGMLFDLKGCRTLKSLAILAPLQIKLQLLWSFFVIISPSSLTHNKKKHPSSSLLKCRDLQDIPPPHPSSSPSDRRNIFMQRELNTLHSNTDQA